MIWLAALALAQTPPPPTVQDIPIAREYDRMSDSEFCRVMTDLTEKVTAELPKMVDAVTRADGMSVFCSLRTVATNKYVSEDVSRLREGWKDRKQQQWNQVICSNEAFGPMARRGWRFVQHLTFQGGQRVSQDAVC